jgi:O-antigen ligase
MIWLLGGYMWLYVHRVFEVWPSLGEMQVERGYMLVMLLAWVVSPSKGLVGNRIHAAMAYFTFALVAAWALSPYGDRPSCVDSVENFAKVAVFYVLVITSVRDERGLRLLILLFLGAVGLYMAHSMWEFLNGRYVWRMGTRRMIGVDVTFGDPNAFASTLLYALPFVLPFWQERPRRLPRYLLVGFVLGAIVCILLTGSRAGFAGLCVLAAIQFVSSSKSKAQAVILCGVAGLLGLLVLSVALPDDLQNRYLTLLDSSRGPQNAQTSADGRIEGFMHGIWVWQSSPLFGRGPASFAYATGRGGQAHNLYGQVLSEMGTAGALALLAVVVCYWLNWRESRRRAAALGLPANDFVCGVARAVGITVVLLLVMGWAGHNLLRYNWQWFAAFGAVAVHCLRLRCRAAEERAHSYVPGNYGLAPSWPGQA